MSPSHPAPPPARPRAAPATLRVAAALATAVVAAVWGASAGHTGAPRPAGPAFTATAPQAPSPGGGGDRLGRGVVRVADHCSMTAANALVPAAGATPPRAGSPDAPQLIPQGGGFPPDFQPVAVISCGLSDQTGPDGTVHRSAVERRATADLEPLLVAYQSPMPSFAFGGGCTAQLDTDPVIAFVDAQGDAIWPAAPRDTCQHLTPGVRTALAALTWSVVDSKPLD